MEKEERQFYTVDFDGFKAQLPILPLPGGIRIAFFNLHGDSALTERCAEMLAEKVKDCEVLITAESKGLQLTHCVASNLGQRFYAVARKSKKLYMQHGRVARGAGSARPEGGRHHPQKGVRAGGGQGGAAPRRRLSQNHPRLCGQLNGRK